MNPMHLVYMLALEKHAGLGSWLAKGITAGGRQLGRGASWTGKGLLGLGINMAGSEVADHFLQKKPEVSKVLVHPGIYQRMQAARLQGEDPKSILQRYNPQRVSMMRG